MVPVPEFVTKVFYFFGALQTSIEEPAALTVQQPLSGSPQYDSVGLDLQGAVDRGPRFRPPHGPEHADFQCDYHAMQGFQSCSTHDKRGCWLKNPITGKEFNIETDYEVEAPKGITRNYHLYASELSINADGVTNHDGQVFNGSYPGPPIRACWGDTISVTVHNDLKDNGTSVHWHGVRQLGTSAMDGVNAITQCAIAPREQFTYTFKALQYGTSWYHSHYSLQYANGLLGPLTIYGPSSCNYDTAKDPLLISDWRHGGAFTAWEAGFASQVSQSITINGKGQYPPNAPGAPARYTTVFQKGVRYLLRLINTSIDTTFIFSIDNHWLTIIETDFVPVKPYSNSSVLIGIGQRYNIIVTATPNTTSPDGNYWIRTTPVTNGCARFENDSLIDERTGIVRYNPVSTADPSTRNWTFATDCSDETYSSLQPIVPWTVRWNATKFDHVFGADMLNISGPPYYPAQPPTPRFELADLPMWLNFTSPTILNLNADFSQQKWLAVVETDSGPESWIVLLITDETNGTAKDFPEIQVPLAHPIHLHGHDFALLVQSSTPFTDMEEVRERMLVANPPRRDVALLPANGYLVIAFKADNPGPWIMHCHIAWHASSGLATQILENPKEIHIQNDVLAQVEQTCKTWTKWWDINGVPKNVQDDSGI